MNNMNNMNNKNKFNNIPKELFESGISKDKTLTVEEAHLLADRLLKQGFAKIKSKYGIK